mmetsp:Transcript_18220/g.16109  ORF Transcript_18220/g.16109 Transcript_18220/m.16109 type:complete len:306 (+) Transcript_18220:256-1173(+)
MIIGSYLTIAVAANAMGVLNAFVALLFIALSELILYSFIYKYLRTQEVKTLIPELLEIESAKKKLQSFYDLTNLNSRTFNMDINQSIEDTNPLQRMIKNDVKEQEVDAEERFRFVKMEDYRMKKLNFSHNMDTIEYQYHTSSENMILPNSRFSFESKTKIPFVIPHHSIDERSLNSIPNAQNINHPASLIMVDLFQRLRDQPKVTREVSSGIQKPQIEKKVKVDPSKNKRKIDETIHTTYENQLKMAKSKKKLIAEKIVKNRIPYTKNIVNKQVILSTSTTGNIILVPKLPSLDTNRPMNDNFIN